VVTIERGSGVRFRATFLNVKKEVVDPTDPEIIVRDPQGTVRVQETPTKEANGIYFHDYNIPSDAPIGNWEVEFKGTVAGLVALERATFYVGK